MLALVFIYTDTFSMQAAEGLGICTFRIWIICVIYVLCLSCFRVYSLLPCGHLLAKGWPLASCLWCLIVLLSLSHVVSWVRCGTWFYRFLIFAPFLTLSEPLLLDNAIITKISCINNFNMSRFPAKGTRHVRPSSSTQISQRGHAVISLW